MLTKSNESNEKMKPNSLQKQQEGCSNDVFPSVSALSDGIVGLSNWLRGISSTLSSLK